MGYAQDIFQLVTNRNIKRKMVIRVDLSIKDGLLQELSCGSNLAYIVEDNAVFLPTEYKVLQSQAEGIFVKCMKLLYNGKIQFYYLTNGLKPFSEILSTLNADTFMTVVSNLFENILVVKNNGFLSCQNIDITFNHIFVDPATYKASLVYLPLAKKLYSDMFTFENVLRVCLIKLIKDVSSLSSPHTMQLLDDLSNSTLSLEELAARIKGKGGVIVEKTHAIAIERPLRENTGSIKLVALNSPVPFEIVITKDEFVLGRKRELVDGTISFNRMIGRTHCKIIHQGNCYAVVDLNSSNGTYVNKARLQSTQPCPIKDGDIIRLANSEFRVVVE